MKTFIAGLFLSAVLVFTLAHVSAQSAEQSAKPAEQQFKNIQVLKGIPADEILPTMQFISNSLGVQCEFCHVRGAFDKDDKKPKLIARKMMQMQMAIDRDNFKGEQAVTCFSCHRGAENPVAVPVIAEESSKPTGGEPAEAAAAALPSADEVLDKYVQAVGGAAALEKVNSRVETGTINLGGRDLPLEVLAKAPDKRISIVHTPNGDNITAFDGHTGWIGNPGGRPPREMSRPEQELVRLDAAFDLPLALRKMFAQFQVRPAEQINGHDAVRLIGVNKDQPPARLFFDKDTGLLVRTIQYTQTPLGRNPTQMDYADYREEGGVKIPLQWTVARPLGRFTVHISKMEQNVPIADSKFERPATAGSNSSAK
jgi:outer membrane lipoprotein-sorting protein